MARGGDYEVQLRGDQVLCDLQQRTCTCYKWELTGISCVHEFTCILDKRVDPDDYVHEAYSREIYLKSYGPLESHVWEEVLVES